MNPSHAIKELQTPIGYWNLSPKLISLLSLRYDLVTNLIDQEISSSSQSKQEVEIAYASALALAYLKKHYDQDHVLDECIMKAKKLMDANKKEDYLQKAMKVFSQEVKNNRIHNLFEPMCIGLSVAGFKVIFLYPDIYP